MLPTFDILHKLEGAGQGVSDSSSRENEGGGKKGGAGGVWGNVSGAFYAGDC